MLESYAARMKEQIPEPDAFVVGLSFGGMLASAMAAAHPQLKVIVIASNKCAGEFPAYLRIGKYLPLYNWVPNAFYKQRGNLKHWLFGARSPEAKKVFAAIQQDSDPAFVRWAIGAILKWGNPAVPKGIVHIHGQKDHLLPCRYVKADHIIKNGTHILPLDFPQEVSLLLKKIVEEEIVKR